MNKNSDPFTVAFAGMEKIRHTIWRYLPYALMGVSIMIFVHLVGQLDAVSNNKIDQFTKNCEQ